MNKKPKILFTTQLSEEKRTQLENNELLIESEPFITIEYQMPAVWKSDVPEKADAWIFTSKKAVKAAAPVIGEYEIPQHIFAVGSKTAQKLEELGLKVSIPEEYNGAALARMMQELDLKNVVHFCGNLRATDFQKLLGSEVKVQMIEVYQTTLTGHRVKDLNDFDGIVFMSPSAVESFSNQNSIPDNMQVFCIGPTTQQAAQDAGMEKCIIPEYASLESLMTSLESFYL